MYLKKEKFDYYFLHSTCLRTIHVEEYTKIIILLQIRNEQLNGANIKATQTHCWGRSCETRVAVTHLLHCKLNYRRKHDSLC